MNLYLTQEHPVDEYLYILKTELQVNFFKYSNFVLIQFHSNLKKVPEDVYIIQRIFLILTNPFPSQQII